MRVFLASTGIGTNKEEQKGMFDDKRSLYVLCTFFEGEKACLKALKGCGNTENFLLDSGAFSFMSGADCTKPILEEYMDRYIDFINTYDIKYFFELDVDTIFGIEYVEYLRKRLEERTGKKCIPVWHKGRGVEYWKWMCANYSYVAIGGLVFHVKKQEYDAIRRMVDYAYAMGVKVHGLGFTRTAELDNYKFYSVDSSSYTKSAAIGQQVHFFNGKRIIARQINKGNKKVKLGVLIRHNYDEWRKYQRYMDSRGGWK